MIRKAVTIFFCVVSLTLLAQKPAQKDSIVFTQLTHDYGTIKKGSPGKCEFQFTNKMKKALVIFNVKPSCGCTVPEYPKNPIAPGEKGIIRVKYNTSTVGRFNKSLTVSSNAVNSTVELKIKGKVN